MTADPSIDVSVVIPSYNSEEFLTRSILSCLAQRDVGVEIIIVDDEGKDLTRDVLEVVKRENPEARLRTIYRAGGLGQATARNEGLAMAQGRYIALLDSDDAFCDNDVLARWVAEADAEDLEMSVARFFNVSPKMVRSKARRIALDEGQVVSVAQAPQLVNVVSCWQILYRRAFLEEHGIIFSPKLKQREDRLFVMEALLKARRVGASGLFVVDHYNVANSSFKQIDAGQLEQYVQHLLELNAAFQRARDEGYSNPDFERANAIIYLRQLDEYWSGICRRLSKFERFQPLVAQYFEQLRLMVVDLGVLYQDHVLDTGPKDGFLREGRMDLLRLALKTNDDEVLTEILRRPKPVLAQMMALRAVDDTAEEVLTRCWSFRRKMPAPAEEQPALGAVVQRVILHTGLPKTGSSSLQQLLERNRIRLWEQGVHYPIFGTNREFSIRRERTPGHAGLVQDILDGDPGALKGLVAEIREVVEVSGRTIDTLILSAENIVSTRFWDRGKSFNALAAAFGDVDLDVVCVLRHPESWFRSLYLEMCGNPWNGFIESPEQFAAGLNARGLLDFEHITRMLEEPEAVDRLHVGCFERIRAEGGIEPWFFELSGLSLEGFAPVPSALRNESQSPHQAAVLRNLKRLKGVERSDLAQLFELVEADEQLAACKAPTPYQAAGLAHFRADYEARIAAYEARFSESSPQADTPEPLDLEAQIDHLLPLLRLDAEEHSRLPQEKFFSVLSKVYDEANVGRILVLDRIDRGQVVRISRQPGEEASTLKILYEDRVILEQTLFGWEDGQKLTLLDTSVLEDLWNAGQRQIELEITSTHRRGRRPFQVVKLLPDDSVWLLPPAFIGRFSTDELQPLWS